VRRLRWIIGSVLITAFGTIVVLNFTPPNKTLETPIEPIYAVDDPQFMRSMGTILGPPLIGGNKITSLYNGVEIFPAMLEAIAQAKRTITFETYIYYQGEIGERFMKALAERAAAGVKVHVLIDYVGGAKIDESYIEQMTAAGAEVERYHPLAWYQLTELNQRTHRKLLVIDGKIGFTGGVGISDEWLGNADSPQHWRDSQFRLEGPAVAQMQATFLDNWMEARGTLLHGDDYFPRLEPVGTSTAQVFMGSADVASESVRMMYLLSIASAKKTIRIANAYFVPDDLAVHTLVEAAKRGVDIQILVPAPEQSDSKMVAHASRGRWGPLLEAGIVISEYQPTMYHCKVMVVDGLWVSVGSTNFDNRSFRLNDEANLNVVDAALAARETETFERDMKLGQRMTLEAWKARPWTERAKESFAKIFRSQL